MPDKGFRLGFLPTRRDGVFNAAVAQKRKQAIEAKLREWNIPYVGLEMLNEEGMIFSGLDAPKVAKYFDAEGVDAVFAPLCNFGCEEAVAKTARMMGKPLLLWAPIDPPPEADGSRTTDSQCGLFATGKVLRQAGVTFTYINNCSLNDDMLHREFQRFISAAYVVKAMRNLRIGQISTRPEVFWSVKSNEMELYERFGVEVVPITLNDLTRMFQEAMKNQTDEIMQEAAGFAVNFDVGFGREELKKAAALKVCLRKWAREQQLSAIAAHCWSAMSASIGGITPCFAFSELTDEHLPAICETDLHGAITSVMAQAATRWQQPSFLADLTMRHPTNVNAELFWHCGVFPKTFSEGRPAVGLQFNRKIPAVCEFQIKPGDYTICRFDGDHSRYSMLCATGRRVEGPHTGGAYGWIAFDNWNALERRFVCGPYIHHCVGIHGRYTDVLEEACRYLPNVQFEKSTEY